MTTKQLPIAHLRSITQPDWMEICEKTDDGAFPVYGRPPKKAKKPKEQVFDYVVARPWYPDEPNSTLCIYAYGGEIQRGTMKQAEGFLKYVRGQKDNEELAKHYGIYVVGMTRITP